MKRSMSELLYLVAFRITKARPGAIERTISGAGRRVIAALLLVDAVPVGLRFGWHQAFVMTVLAWLAWAVRDVPRHRWQKLERGAGDHPRKEEPEGFTPTPGIYAWDDQLKAGTCGMAMVRQASLGPYWYDADLYNLARYDENETVRALAAKLYVTEKRLQWAPIGSPLPPTEKE